MAVRDKYPEMPIEGSNYPPVKWKEYLAHAINILKITAIAAIVSGSNPFQLVGLGEPAIMQWAHSNKVFQIEKLSRCFQAVYLMAAAWDHIFSIYKK
ncbi:selT/selW/selH selenoprotein [Teladorsagia circumcincta]|uniref:SelT/selW/selH selenoprotein n=1 Tax=Teladorsagia circumcincta TaxID=45464 RepID=A0A2G9UV61_TELCI|nr:selT/selW/selH selenoprotein [Teladorsagia circumcincta]